MGRRGLSSRNDLRRKEGEDWKEEEELEAGVEQGGARSQVSLPLKAESGESKVSQS